MYRAIAQGLTWLSGKKKTEHCHRDLRARANAHLRKHQAQYVAEWDGYGPSLEKLAADNLTKEEGFTKYLDLAEKESAYGSALELKALSRIYDVCLMVIPRDANFGSMVFKEAKAQKHRAIVLWYTPKHIDLVMPATPADHYPEALFAGCTGQVIDLRAGGRSDHPGDEASSVWTKASNAPSTHVRSQASRASKQPSPEAPVPPASRKVARSHSSAAASIQSGTVWTATAAGSKKRQRSSAESERIASRKTVWTRHQPAQTSCSIASGCADATSLDDLHIPEAPEAPETRRRKDHAPDRFRTPQGPAI